MLFAAEPGLPKHTGSVYDGPNYHFPPTDRVIDNVGFVNELPSRGILEAGSAGEWKRRELYDPLDDLAMKSLGRQLRVAGNVIDNPC